MLILLDTSAYSEFFRGHRGVREALQRAEEIVLSPVTLGELRSGFRLGSRQERNEHLLRQFLASPRVRQVVADAETSEQYAKIFTTLRRAGAPIPTNDIWIAASALQHGLRVVTIDPHFERIPHLAVDRYPPS